jgi:NAD(P)H-flavin reductase
VLGRDHRKFGVTAAHYPAVCDAFLDTMAAFLGDAWTAEVRDAWQDTFSYVSKIMISAAGEDAAGTPPWWLGEVLGHDRLGPDLAVVSVRPDQPFPYQAGQYVSLQCARWPRIWRKFSIANAPRADGLLQFHVRAVPGGWVSGALVRHTEPGDTLLLGPAAGTMVADPGSTRDVLCIAGGTGLAPIKAIVQQLVVTSKTSRTSRDMGDAADPQRNIHLLFGARTEKGLYDLPALREMERSHPPLRVIPVVSDEPEFGGLRGTLPDIAGRLLPGADHDVYLSGPAEMVRKTTEVLTALGIPITRMHNDPVC